MTINRKKICTLGLVFFGVSFLRLTVLWEQDIFWQIRAGYEILENGKLQDTEQWSYTAQNTPWLNIQWLTTVIFALIHWIGDHNGLIVFRGLLLGLLFMVIGTSLFITNRNGKITAMIATLAVVYVALAHRMQLRADTFNFLLFALAPIVWHQKNLSIGWKRSISMFIAILAANIHPGTTPFVILSLAAWGWQSKQAWWLNGLWSASYGLGLLITPYHITAIPFLVEHFFYFDNAGYQNPDHQPIQLHHFGPGFRFGAVAMGLLALSRLCEDLKNLQQGGFKPFVLLSISVILTYLCQDRIRAFPYMAIWCAPVLFKQLNKLIDYKASFHYLPLGLLLLCIGAYSSNPSAWGFSLWPKWPVKLTEFIKKNKVSPKIYHGPTLGSYTIWHLRGYKGFSDTRETPFRKVDRLRHEANNNPTVFETVVQRYSIQASLMPIPYNPVAIQKYIDVFNNFYPQERWALVGIEKYNVLFVRRIPEHQGIIEKFEYKMLRPNLEPYLYFMIPNRNQQSDHNFKRELERCIEFDPSNIHCHLSTMQFLRESQASKTKLEEQYNKLKELWRHANVNDRWHSFLKAQVEKGI